MRDWHLLASVIAGLILALTYFLVQGTMPDASLHERTLGALRSLALNDAALQRDVLRARAGLLRNYDVLMRSVENLRDAATALQSARHVVHGLALADMERHVEGVATAVREQENFIEALKSSNALLQNSLTYFSHPVVRIGRGPPQRDAAAAQIGEAAKAMLAFLQQPHGASARQATSTLDRLEKLHVTEGDLQQTIKVLVAHGRLIVSTLPEVDDLVARVQAAPISSRAQDLQDAYLDLHGQAAVRAGFFRILLYAASVALAAYVGYLFLQLRAKAQNLQARLDLENLIARISTQFISRARDRIGDGIRDALAQVAQHTGVERARVVVYGADEPKVDRSYLWGKSGADVGGHRLEPAITAQWGLPGYECHGCVRVASVQSLPQSAERTYLEEQGIRSWLYVPMWLAGKRIGTLTLDTISVEKHWAADDIALLRTVAETFANAIARERSEIEREAMEVHLNQAQRLESLGTLAGGIAHEFNNILGAILGYGELALAALRKQDLARRHVQQIMAAGRRAQEVIDQILAFGRRSDRQYRPTKVQAVIAEAVDLLRASLPATITLHPQFNAEGAIVLADSTQLQQVVMNLCTNAAQAMQSRGAIDIRLDTVEVEHDLTLSHGRLSANRHVRLSVSDTGHGIDASVIERIFEPFFTTKPVGQGTGLGLPTVHGIVSQHGGALNVESRPGAGTTFEVYLPHATDIRASDNTYEKEAAPRGHGETILIVDDEKPLVLLGEEMLAALGYEGVGFDSSTAALAAFRADPRRFDLVLTDEVMPELTGTELATAVHRVRPELPILLMTGHHMTTRSRRLDTLGIREVLKKPLLSTTLATSLATHFAARGLTRS